MAEKKISTSRISSTEQAIRTGHRYAPLNGIELKPAHERGLPVRTSDTFRPISSRWFACKAQPWALDGDFTPLMMLG